MPRLLLHTLLSRRLENVSLSQSSGSLSTDYATSMFFKLPSGNTSTAVRLTVPPHSHRLSLHFCSDSQFWEPQTTPDVTFGVAVARPHHAGLYAELKSVILRSFWGLYAGWKPNEGDVFNAQPWWKRNVRSCLCRLVHWRPLSASQHRNMWL